MAEEPKRRPISAEEEQVLLKFGRSLSNLRSPASIAAYQSDIRLFAEQTPGVDLLRITDAQVDHYIAELHRLGFKNRTLNRKATSLRYFREFVARGSVKTNGLASMALNATADRKPNSEPDLSPAHNIIDQGLSTFLRKVRETHSQATVRAYTSDLIKFRKHLRNTADWRSVTKQFVSDFINQQVASGLNANSTARLLSTIRSLFRWLQHNCYIVGNPTLKLHVPRGGKRDLIPSITVLETIASGNLPSALPALRDLLIFELLYESGLRPAEISHLDISSVDLNRKRLKVQGRGDRRRHIELPVNVERVLARYLPIRMRIRCNSSAPLVVNLKGGRLSPRSIGRAVKQLAAAYKLPEGTHPHTLRHAYAYRSLKAGKHVQDIRHALGVAGISSGTRY